MSEPTPDPLLALAWLRTAQARLVTITDTNADQPAARAARDAIGDIGAALAFLAQSVPALDAELLADLLTELHVRWDQWCHESHRGDADWLIARLADVSAETQR